MQEYGEKKQGIFAPISWILSEFLMHLNKKVWIINAQHSSLPYVCLDNLWSHIIKT